MNSMRLLMSMTDIDDALILDALSQPEPKPRRNLWWSVCRWAAACLCIVLISTILYQAIKPMRVSAFEIEDGVLLAYTGTDTKVVIPAEVTSIASSAFAAAPSPDSITSVTLGPNVESIDALTFAQTKNLNHITVPKENTNFYYQDGVLLAADGSLAIDTARSYEKSMDLFLDAVGSMTGEEAVFSEGASFVFGKTEISVEVQGSENGSLPVSCYMTAIDFDGAHLELEPGTSMSSNSAWDFYQSDDILIYSNMNQSGYGTGYLFADGEVKNISNPQTRKYNDSIYLYGTDGAGKITYRRQPHKYVDDGESVSDLLYCTGRDELFLEEGYVLLDEGNLTYAPTAVYTVEEKWDLEDKFANLCVFADKCEDSNTVIDITALGYPPCETLEELLAYNDEYYESWE